MKTNLNYLMSASFAILGSACIFSGIAMPKLVGVKETNSVVKLNVTQKKVSTCKSNEIKLADISLEVNNPLSINVRDYLQNPNDVEESIIKRLKLDTSNVNTTQVGSYIYTITYNKKIYNGNLIVKAKPLPQVEIMTLNSLSYEVGTKLSTNISTYVKEDLAPEVIAATHIDLSNVDTSKPGSYLYSISYNGKLYTSNITIYEPKYGETKNIDIDKSNAVTTENDTNKNS